jgi:hypothetical protein
MSATKSGMFDGALLFDDSMLGKCIYLVVKVGHAWGNCSKKFV